MDELDQEANDYSYEEGILRLFLWWVDSCLTFSQFFTLE